MNLHYRVQDDEAVARCPYHSDGHPSWSVNINSGVFYCFACGAKGNLAKLIHDLLGISYTEAVILANETVGFARMDKWRENFDNVSFSPMSLKVTEMDMALFTSPPNQSLVDKNINTDAAEYFNILWNMDHESWITPYYDPFSNELWGWQEKNARIFRNFPAGTKKSKTLFGYRQLKRSGAILVESPLDCAVMCSAGFEHTVSTFGVPTGTYQLSLIQRKCSTIILALDNDQAGIKATRELIPEALKMFDSVKVFNYDISIKDYGRRKFKDPGEMDYDEIEFAMKATLPAIDWMRKNQ